MSVTQVVEPGGRVQIPADWLEELGLRGSVVLEKTVDGVIVRPAPAVTWEEIFRDRLPMRNSPVETEIQVTKDDLLF